MTCHTPNLWPVCTTCPPPPTRAVRLRRLRAHVVERAGAVCEWPHCQAPHQQMAHLHHRGMGGNPAADRPDNVAMLCATHHDILDGRTALGTLRTTLNETLYRAITRT